MSLIEEAAIFSKIAHESIGQKRKYTGNPYYIHPRNVALLLSCNGYGADETIIASAYLHDIYEDVNRENKYFSLGTIKEYFGTDIMLIVESLSTDVLFPDGTRAERNKLKLQHYSKLTREAAIVKIADLTDNCSDIVKHDKDFAKIYLNECLDIFKVLWSLIQLDSASNRIKDFNFIDACHLTLLRSKESL